MTKSTNIIQMHHEYTRKHENTHIQHVLNGDVVMVCNHTGSYQINQHCLSS